MEGRNSVESKQQREYPVNPPDFHVQGRKLTRLMSYLSKQDNIHDKQDNPDEVYARAMERLQELNQHIAQLDQRSKKNRKIKSFIDELKKTKSSFTLIEVLKKFRALMLEPRFREKIEYNPQLQVLFFAFLGAATDLLTVAMLERMRTVFLEIPEEEIPLIKNKEKSPHFAKFVWEQVVTIRHVQFDILSQKTFSGALLAISMWAIIAKKCIDLGNYQSAMGVRAALISRYIQRLRGREKQINKEETVTDYYLIPYIRLLLSEIDIKLGNGTQDTANVQKNLLSHTIPYSGFYLGAMDFSSEGFNLGAFHPIEHFKSHLKANSQVHTQNFSHNLCFSDERLMKSSLFKKDDIGFQEDLSKMSQMELPSLQSVECIEMKAFVSNCIGDPKWFGLLTDDKVLDGLLLNSRKATVKLLSNINELRQEIVILKTDAKQLETIRGADIFTPLTEIRKKKEQLLILTSKFDFEYASYDFLHAWQEQQQEQQIERQQAELQKQQKEELSNKEAKFSWATLWEKMKIGGRGSLNIEKDADQKIKRASLPSESNYEADKPSLQTTNPQNNRRASLPPEDSKSSYETGKLSLSRQSSMRTENTIEGEQTVVNNKELRRANSEYFYKEKQRLEERIKLFSSPSAPLIPVTSAIPVVKVKG